ASDDPDEGALALASTGRGVLPDIVIGPASQDFGDVVLGSFALRSFTVGNSGSSALAVTGAAIAGADSADFSITRGAAPFALAPGESLAVEVRYEPSVLGPRIAALQLESDDPDEPVVDLPLAGTGVEPDVRISPSSIEWGDVLVASTVPRVFTIANDGTSDLHVASSVVGPDSTEFAVVANGGPLTIAAGDSVAVEVAFGPASLGPKLAALRVASDDPDEAEVEAVLAGRGVQPDVAVDPVAHDYGATLLSEVRTHPFTVVNVGTAPLAVEAASLVGAHSADFAVIAGGAPFVLAPGESSSVEVAFDPSELGPRAAALRLTSDDPDEGALDVALAGLAVEPEIAVVPPAFDWGGARLAESVPHVFAVVNEGTADLHVGGATLEGTDAAEFTIVGAGAFTLAPGDTLPVEVQFHPATLGAKSAALHFANDDLDEGPALAVALAGAGVEPEIAVAPAAHDWGGLRLSETVSQTWLVTNEGTHDLAIEAVALDGPDAADFTIVSGAGPFVLGPGGSASIEVSFQPSALGARSAVLRFASDDLDESEVDVALSGAGVEPDIVIEPLAHAWGDVLVATSASAGFVVRNVGTDELTIDGPVLLGVDPAEFAVLAGAAPFVLGPGDSTILDVGFEPTSAGDKTAELRVASDDPDEAVLFVSLSGRGVTPEIEVEPVALGFGSARMAETVRQALRIANGGTSALHVATAGLVGPDAADFVLLGGAAPFALAPGETLGVDLDFQPSALGPRTAALRLTSDDLGEGTLDVPLAGEGVEPNVAVLPQAWD
ncbi:MAG: choice-of-anchor D domain-containing protein, partial [bacterium]